MIARNKNIIVILLVLIINTGLINAQSRIDSLENILNSSSIPLKKVILSELIDEYQDKSLGQSLEYGNEALNLAIERGDKKWIIDSYIKIGQIFLKAKIYDEAFNDFIIADKISNEIFDSSYIAKTSHFLGIAYYHLGDTTQSYHFLEKALQFNNPALNPHEAGDICKDLADYYLKIQRHNKAFRLYKISLDYYQQSDDFENQVFVLCGIATIKANTGYYFDARIIYFRALKISLKQNMQYYNSQIAIKIAEILFSYENSTALAITHLNEALKIANKEGFLDLQTKIHDQLSIIYEDKKMFKTSLYYKTTYYSLKDSLQRINTQKYISFLEMKYDLDKYENEISLLSKKNEISQNELEKQKRIQKFTIIALFLFSILAVLSLIYYYHKKKMVEKLNGKKEALEKSNQLLIKSREDLNILNDTKNKIFSVLAHDLINPFNALLGFASLLNEESQHLNKKEIKQYGEIIYQTATNLLYLLENLLQWSKSQTGKIVVNKKNTELTKVLKSVLSIINILADKKQITINTSFQSNCFAFIDADLISSALRNLIQNAIKFTSEGNTINISTECTNDETRIIISDTGTGISEEDQGKLFHSNKHFTTPGTSNEQGTGLGLMITREFIKLNNGKLTLSSEIGKGSTFTIILPLLNPDKSNN
ncbi:MAG: hypothetical protein DRI73_00260 [Bacteroidetes bacterium]|nr:MAG: hypothetical protein DRI73_00260 [Bacteroidota bacterium]